MDLEGFSPIGSTSTSPSYSEEVENRKKYTVNKNLSVSTPVLKKESNIRPLSSLSNKRNLSFQLEIPERKIKNNIESIDGIYKLQRIHKLPMYHKPLHLSFNPLHQTVTKCSIISITSSFLKKFIYECQSEKILSDNNNLNESDNGLNENFLIIYNVKDSCFIDLYYHQHKQRYTINTRPSEIYQNKNSNNIKQQNKKLKKTLTVSQWPHQIHCKKIPSCHLFYSTQDLNILNDRLFIIIGFTSGEIIVYEPWNNYSYPIQKSNSSCVNCIQWIPNKRGEEIVVGYSDGSIIFLSLKYKTTPNIPSSVLMMEHIKKEGLFSIWKNSSFPQSNPLIKWQFTDNPIHDIKFSPTNDYIAIATGDGYINIIDLHENYHKIKLKSSSNTSKDTFNTSKNTNSWSIELGHCFLVFKSYFGGILSITWSPDELYILAGGEDDFVSIWSFKTCKLVARCQGHRSWVSCVAFDPYLCYDGNYRFGSVGQDGRLLLWNYSIRDTLRRSRSRSSFLSRSKKNGKSPLSDKKINDKQYQNINDKNSDFTCLIINAPGRNEIPILDPIADHRAHNVPSNSIYFTTNSIITAGNKPYIRVWARPNRYVPNIKSQKLSEKLSEKKEDKNDEIKDNTIKNDIKNEIKADNEKKKIEMHI